MPIKIKHKDPKSTDFGPNDIVINIKKGTIFYKSEKSLFKLQGDNLNTTKDVINFEPKLALDGGLDGTSEIRKVINKSSELIKKNGKLVLEIAFDQKHKVKKMLKDKGFYINKVLKDFGKKDRCVISTKI